MKILNLYACLGGNRYKWDEVAKEAGIEIEVTAVELDPVLADMYQDRFPNDTVVVADAHQYLIDHVQDGWDFIWTSPPCPSHSRINTDGQQKPRYPDMKLYEEVIMLSNNWFKGKYVVENVIPYYTPLIPANKRGRHLYWTNFNLPNVLSERKCKIGGLNEVKRLCEFHDYDFYTYKGKQPTKKIARNLVDYEAGKRIFETAIGIIRKENPKQTELF
jgi:DNA (cytosine-5)-methyltransferase 1